MFLYKLKVGKLFVDEIYHLIRFRAASIPMLYGLPQLHKDGIPLRPIMAFTGSFNYQQSWSLGQNLRDRDEALTLRDRDFEQKLETRPRLERSETETRHETFETKSLQYFANIFDPKFRTFNEFPNTLQYRFLGISLLY